MRSNGRRLGFVIMLAAWVLGALATISTAQAAGQLSLARSLEATVGIEPDGRTKITEILTYNNQQPLEWTIRFPSWERLAITNSRGVLAREDWQIVKAGRYKKITTMEADNYWQLSFQTKDAIQLTKQQDFFRWEVISQPNIAIEKIRVLVRFPAALDSSTTRQRVYAYHGITAAEAQLVDSHTIQFTGEAAAPEAGFTVMASWPSSGLQISWWQKLIVNISSVELVGWTICGLALPLITFGLLIIMYVAGRGVSIGTGTKAVVDRPPMDLPPLLIGILWEKRIKSSALLGAIFDLCRRGYLAIIKEGEHYYFGIRKKPDDKLLGWERDLMTEIFVHEPVITAENVVFRRAEHQLFNRKIMGIYEAAYEAITQLGYFKNNPHRVRMGYKIIGIILYLVALIGLAWAVLTFQPAFLLLPISGMLLSTFVIIRLANIMPPHSLRGKEAIKQWRAFYNFLTKPEALAGHYSVSGIFYEYLPYAIIFGVEREWMRRFRDYRLVVPDWLKTQERIEAEQVVPEIMTTISHISFALSQLKGPAVT